MPVYEFYCSDCHAIFSFLSRRVNTQTRPPCPECDRSELTRQISVFSAPRQDESSPEVSASDTDFPEQVAYELAAANHDNPEDIARVMSSLYRSGAVEPGDAMREALGRMAAGEDPEQIEADLGAVLDLDETGPGFSQLSRHQAASEPLKAKPPRIVPELFELNSD